MAFQPGISGNPTGKVPSKPFAEALRRALARAEAEGKGTALNRLAEKLLEAAAAGDMPAMKEVADRLDGKPAQAIVGDIDHPAVQVLVANADSKL